jgi:DNA-binding NarL/FixJ family response regulator
MPDKLRVVIADDHPIFRKGLRQVIESNTDIAIVEEAEDGEAALRCVESARPDLAILDIDMPAKNGLEVLRELRARGVDTPVVFLTMYDDEEMFNEAMDEGVQGYVLKENAVRDILECIRLVTAGKYYISPTISSFLVQRNNRARELRKAMPGLDDLTSMERKILRLIAEGHTSKEIANVLHLSPKTIDNHRLSISNKLNIHGTHQLLKFAVQHKSRL